MSDQSLRPSKQFIVRGSIAASIIAIILIVQTNWFHSLFRKDAVLPSPEIKTVGDIVGEDSNGNEIPDWEERLWGLDPTVLYTNGVSNKELIEAKKRAAGIADVADEDLNETDRVARQLFTLATALGQSGSVDEGTIQNVASSLSSSIDIKKVDHHYSLVNIQTKTTSTESLRTYYKQLTAVTSRYDKSLADVDVLLAALETGDYSGLAELTETAKVYKQVAAEVAKIPTPIGVAGYQLDIINGFYGISESFQYLQAFEENSIYGLMGLAIYRNNSTRLDLALINLGDYLQQYGIL